MVVKGLFRTLRDQKQEVTCLCVRVLIGCSYAGNVFMRHRTMVERRDYPRNEKYKIETTFALSIRG